MASVRWQYLTLLFRRLWKLLLAYAGVWVAASLGFYLVESGQESLLTSFYWAIVTLSTVGYGDVVPTTPVAHVFTISVILVEVFLTAYLLSVVVAIVTEESQQRALGTLGTTFRGHIVVLGYGPVGQAAVRELLAEEEVVAVVTANPDELPHLRALAPDNQLYATYGPLAETTILRRANVPAASAVIVATDDDTLALVAALNVRTLNPNIRIVVSVTRPELKQTLRTAGVTYVSSPGDLGGRLCADASFRPEVASAIEDLTLATYHADLTEYLLSDKTPVSTQTLPEAERLVRTHTDCLVVGYARPNGAGEYETVLNPPASLRFQPGDAILVLGSLENLKKFHRWFGIPQGR